MTNHIYHVSTITAGREKLFSDVILGRMVVRSLFRLQDSHRARTLAYVVMPDHLHWLLQLLEASSLSRTVGSMKSQSARRIKQATSGEAAVWHRGFHDRALRKDEDIVKIARYIAANPIRAGVVRKVGDYPLWDSIWV